ncbi:MAG: GNAT superfamily N-acetyltransferase [Myxococcota bacterium]
MSGGVSVRALAAGSPEVDGVALRMRATLIDVLGAERGGSMYTLDWLRGRVGEHLGRPDAAVFVAERGGEVVGQSIVRVEVDATGPFGLVSTTYVLPTARRTGVARHLLAHDEAWMRGRGLVRSATNTAATNRPLIQLYEGAGYRIDLREGEMIRLVRSLT